MDRKKLINQSIDYIMKHLVENLSLDTVAAHFFIGGTIRDSRMVPVYYRLQQGPF